MGTIGAAGSSGSQARGAADDGQRHDGDEDEAVHHNVDHDGPPVWAGAARGALRTSPGCSARMPRAPGAVATWLKSGSAKPVARETGRAGSPPGAAGLQLRLARQAPTLCC